MSSLHATIELCVDNCNEGLQFDAADVVFALARSAHLKKAAHASDGVIRLPGCADFGGGLRGERGGIAL
jgi:hypothetical protein